MDELILPVVTYVDKRTQLPSRALKEHIAAFHDLVLVLSGSVTYLVDGTQYPLSSGSVAYIPQGSLKQTYMNPGDSMVSYSCRFECLSISGGIAAAKSRLPLPIVSTFASITKLEELYAALHEIWQTKPEGHQQRTSAYLLLILSALQHQISTAESANALESPHLTKAKSYIASHIHRPLRTAELADACELHPVYLASLFREHMGMSVKEYMNQSRMERAKELLRSGEYSVAEAAERCGMEDPFYFSKVFKRTVGVSPASYISSFAKQ
jgi:AraC family L-rhamnose operon regulatory protein RhaS